MASCTYNPRIDSVNPYAVLNVTQQSQNVAANTSVVRYELLIYRPSAIYSSASKSYSITVNGARVKSGTTTIGGSGTKSIASGTTTISHNADGTKSISFSFSLDFEITWSGRWIGTGSASGSMTLSTIPRATTPGLSPTTVTMGNNLTINLPRASGSFTHTLQHDFYVGSWTTFATGVGTSATLSVPLDWANRIPSATSGGGRIRCLTYNGGTLIGEKIANFTATVPTNIVPSISDVVISEATAGLAAKFAAYVQNNSTLSVKITAAGAYSSTIKSYSTKINGATYSGSNVTSGAITTSGSVAVDVTVTDTRGRTATVKKTIDVIPYSFPTITEFSVQRAGETGTIDDDGVYALVSLAYAISPINDKNDNVYTIEYKKESDADWKTLKTGTGYEFNGNMNLGAVLDEDYSFNFRVTVKDYFTTIINNALPVPTAFTPLDFKANGKGIAFGEVANEDGFSVNMPAAFRKDVSFADKTGEGTFECGFPAIFNSLVTYGGFCVPRFIAGTRVITDLNGVTNVTMFSLSKLKTIFNVTEISPDPTAIHTAQFQALFSNGDGNAEPMHVDGATWINETLFAVFDRPAYGAIRINYVIMYFDKLYEK